LAFTAAGDRYSIDAWLRKGRGQEPRTAGPSFPIRLLELQLAWIYLATGLEKWAGSSWRDGTANSYVFQLSHTFARPFVAPLASYSGLVRGFTWETLAVELAFLPLVFLPGPCRLIAVSGAALLQLGILAMLNVGNFPLIMLCMLILFLPAGAVSRLMRDGGPSPSPSPRGSGNWGRWAGYVGLAALAYAAFSLALPARFGMLGPPKPVRDALMFSGLDQSWNMFSPNPTRRDWSIVAPGQLSDGSEIEVLPSSWGPFYSRRMKILDYLTRPSYGDYLQEFGRSICRLRNNHLQSGQPQLLNFQITLVDRVVQAPGTTGPTVSEQVLWTHQCLS
ncbi:MAG TPA: HTTM domain-containing protein, partial [Chloroflexota bacterium]